MYIQYWCFCTYVLCSFQATQAKAWICFDGPLSGNWVDILDGLISKEKVLHVKYSLNIVTICVTDIMFAYWRTIVCKG